MRIGYYISGIAHAGLIGWVMFGGVFDTDLPPVEVMDVSMITSEDFDTLLRAQEAPVPSTDVAVPEMPDATAHAPEMTSRIDEAVSAPTPAETEAAAPDASPDLSDITAPEPQDVTDEAPQMSTPDVDTALVLPESALQPQPTPSTRVAPEPVAQPEPDVAISDELREATKPDEAGETAETILEERAPEAASSEISTEPKQVAEPTSAPSRSVRPKLRPQQTARPTVSATDDAVTAALQEAAAGASAVPAAAPSGPPLTSGERDGLRVAVQACWVVDVGSRAADVTVVVGLTLDQNGRVSGDIRQISATGGDEAAVRTAFNAARRAVLRCQKTGYDLPVEKYDRWRDIEITFNPEKMRRK